MPEALEAEIWRRALTDLVGRRIDRVEADVRTVDPAIEVVVGERIRAIRRHGKVVLVDTTGPVIGLRFGMTGRVVVDGVAPIETLEYASSADRPEWDRLLVWAGSSRAPAIRLNDPRRLGRVELDPDLSGLGPDVFALDRDTVAATLRNRRAAIKVLLMDQGVVAGLGNLCVDEVLFAASIDPATPGGALSGSQVTALCRAIGRRLPAMLEAGGSTTGVLDPERRRRLGPCPRRGCAGSLQTRALGGRTTVWCPAHQPAVTLGRPRSRTGP